MQLLVRIVGRVLAASSLLGEPGVESGRNQAVGALLELGGAHRDDVRVLVLRVLVMPAYPAPVYGMGRLDLHELLPQLGVFQRAGLAAPAPRLPVADPLGHPLHEVLGVGQIANVGVLPLEPDPLQRRDRTGESHLVVGRVRGALVEVPARDAIPGGRFNQRGVPSGTRLGGIVAETALVGVDEHEGERGGRGHGWMTTGMSVRRRISSACETLRWVPSRAMCAPANRASHLVRSTTRATASAGVPRSMCVTKATPCSESVASASPPAIVALAGAIVAGIIDRK